MTISPCQSSKSISMTRGDQRGDALRPSFDSTCLAISNPWDADQSQSPCITQFRNGRHHAGSAWSGSIAGVSTTGETRLTLNPRDCSSCNAFRRLSLRLPVLEPRPRQIIVPASGAVQSSDAINALTPLLHYTRWSRSMNSSGLCACSILPGPQRIV